MKLIREEMSSQKMYRVVEDSLQMPYETFRVDFETFQTVFIALSPWGKGATAETLASGIFKVSSSNTKRSLAGILNLSLIFFLNLQLMDENNNGYLNIRQVIRGLGLTCSGPPEERLKLLFKLHMPPFLSDFDIPQKEEKENDETLVAAEATEFFQNLSHGNYSSFILINFFKSNFLKLYFFSQKQAMEKECRKKDLQFSGKHCMIFLTPIRKFTTRFQL